MSVLAICFSTVVILAGLITSALTHLIISVLPCVLTFPRSAVIPLYNGKCYNTFFFFSLNSQAGLVVVAKMESCFDCHWIQCIERWIRECPLVIPCRSQATSPPCNWQQVLFTLLKFLVDLQTNMWMLTHLTIIFIIRRNSDRSGLCPLRPISSELMVRAMVAKSDRQRD